MQIIDQSWDWVQKSAEPLKIIEAAGRTCYKSEEKITADSADKFVRMVRDRGHESVIEHAIASVRFITNRGVTHELVRHRLCSFSQESTRYVRYEGDMEFIRPVWWDAWSPEQQAIWRGQMEAAEEAYGKLLQSGAQPQQAREVLPNSLKTEIVVTTNLREWRSIFSVRTSRAAHPQIRELMIDCLRGFRREMPAVFDDFAV